MNALIISLFVFSVVSAGVIPHIPSGSVGVSNDGALVAESIHTDNGLHGHTAGVRLSGPSADISTHEGYAILNGPGNGHDDGLWNNGNEGNNGNNWEGKSWENEGNTWNNNGDDGQWHEVKWDHGNNGQWEGKSLVEGNDWNTENGQWNNDEGKWIGQNDQWNNDEGKWKGQNGQWNNEGGDWDNEGKWEQDGNDWSDEHRNWDNESNSRDNGNHGYGVAVIAPIADQAWEHGHGW